MGAFYAYGMQFTEQPSDFKVYLLSIGGFL